MKSINIAVQNAYLDSHNLTGDIVESLAKAFGGSQYFHPADYALGSVGDEVTSDVNAALSSSTACWRTPLHPGSPGSPSASTPAPCS